MGCLKSLQEDGIPVSGLPPTFQHAVFITKMLGVHYLWIDSLCIIQDSKEDWLQESVKMWAIYGNAFCNIAATSSSDSYGGLFHDRNGLSALPCKIQATWHILRQGHYYCVDEETLEREVDEAPLNARGWVLQEQALSPRILHFGAREQYWECRELTAPETFPTRHT